MQGIKYDAGKPALDLIDPEFELAVGRVLSYGAQKYAIDNWKRGMSLGKALAGVKRHINAISRGDFNDPETGLPHAAHATCGLMFLDYFIRNDMLTVPDDRFQAAPLAVQFPAALDLEKAEQVRAKFQQALSESKVRPLVYSDGNTCQCPPCKEESEK